MAKKLLKQIGKAAVGGAALGVAGKVKKGLAPTKRPDHAILKGLMTGAAAGAAAKALGAKPAPKKGTSFSKQVDRLIKQAEQRRYKR